VTADTSFDDFSDISPENIEAQAGPLTGSRGTNRSAGTARAPRGTRLQKKLDTLQARLSQEMFMGGTVLGMGLPVTGYYICQESNGFTKAVVELASSRPEWVEALEHLADLGPGITIGRTVLGMGAALSVDRAKDEETRKARLDKAFMKFLGVYSAYQAVHGEGKGQSNGASSYSPPPFGTFVPVS
jgi:hypothetical protein